MKCRILLMVIAGWYMIGHLSAQEVGFDFVPGALFFKINDQVNLEIPTIDRLNDKSLPVDDLASDPAQTNSVLKDFGKLVHHYRIEKIEKAFHLADPKLQKIYRLACKDTSGIDGLLAALEKLPYIEYAEKIPLPKQFLTPNDLHTNQWHLNVIQAEQAWDITMGSNTVVIAVVDDAVKLSHEDLSGNKWINPGEIPNNGVDDDGNGYIDDVNGYDVSDQDNNPNPPASATNNSFTHGTHCAGIAAAATHNNIGIASISYQASIMAVKCKPSSTTGPGIPDAYLGVQYAIAADADVISMSWGGSYFSTTYQMLFDYANSLGIVLVAAAGNQNSSTPMYPASYNPVISVGSTDLNDVKAGSSSYGTTIDVMAPGQNIWSALAGSNSSYGYLSGTSMACPLVSGLAALMLSMDPNLSPEDLEICLKNSCDNIDAQNPAYMGQLGAGRINAYQALICLGAIKADFAADHRQICPGTTVQFSDQSLNNPTSWLWDFPGGMPSFSTQQNPTISYPTSGTYDVTLIASNSSGSDTLTRTAYIEVGIPAGVLSGSAIIFSGNSSKLKVDLTGKPPWSISYHDGVAPATINGISTTPHFITVSPAATTTYTLTAVSDADCVGIPSGSATITIDSALASCVTFKSHQKISDTEGNFSGILDNSDVFGRAVANIGDLDGDGVNDIAVGAYQDDDGGADFGAVWILFLNLDGTVKNHQKISDLMPNFTGQLGGFDFLGASITTVGDLDGDGVQDIVVGAHYDDDGGVDKGALYVFFLNTNGTIKAFQKISDTQGGFPSGVLDNGDRFGVAVTNLGDMDGDAIPDIAVGAVFDDDGGANKGAIHILFLNNNGTVKAHQKISSTAGNFAGILDNGDEFGIVSAIEDLDGDGVTDLAVGAYFDDDGGADRGAVWILFLNNDGTVKAHQKISNTQGNFNGILDDVDRLGFSVASIGDVNRDRLPDLAVGANLDDDGGSDRGAVWMICLNQDGTVKEHRKISATAGDFTGVLDDGDNFGMAVSGLGDLDGNGVNDIVVGAYHDDDGGSDRGAVWMLFLEDTCDADSCVITAGFVASDTLICDSTTILFTNTSIHASLYEWQVNGSFYDTTADVSIRFDTAGVYRVSLLAGTGSCRDTAEMTITALGKPLASFITADTAVCESASLHFFNLSTHASLYEWQLNGSFYDTTTQVTIPFDTAGAYVITLIADNGLCRDTFSKTIMVVANPVAQAWPDTTVCLGDSVQLSASPGIFHYWFPTEDSHEHLLPDLLAKPDTTTQYGVIVIAASGCDPDTASVTVWVNPPPTAEAGPDITILRGEEIQLGACCGHTYAWSPPHGLNCSDCPHPSAQPDETTTYHVTVFDSIGCTASDSLTLFLETDLFIPNMFSPNGDGINDIFQVYSSALEALDLSIYNRWGELIFRSNDMHTGWDGSFKGKPQPAGAFIWRINGRYAGGEEIIINGGNTGSVLLIR